MNPEELKSKGRYILDRLVAEGADKAQVTVSAGELEEFNVDSGEFSLIRTVYNSGASMKALKDSKKGVSSVNDLSEENLDAAAAECVALARSGKADPDYTIAEKTTNAVFSEGPLVCEKEKFLDNVIRFIGQVKDEFPKIMLEQVIASYSRSDGVFMNTNGVEHRETSGCYSISVMFSAQDGDEVTSFNHMGFEFTDPEEDILSLADLRNAFRRAERELYPKELDEKFVGTAVIMPQCLDDFTDIIFGFTGDVALMEKTSPWYGKKGEKVADESFTMKIIPRDERIIGGEKITADGYIAENYTLIENGVLRDYSLSEYGARKTGFDRAPSTSGAIEILPGDKSLDEIIAGIDRGILVGRFSGGEPGVNGDFSGVAKNSFLIRDGKIDCALKETMISGAMLKMLNNIRAISSETVNDASCVLPWVAFDGVTVS